jgi:dolichol-phosphate mannosyltransferase
LSELLSVVVPVYYNEDNIPVTWEALRNALAKLPADLDWEVVFVEDGSGDRSYERLLEVARAEPQRVRIVKLTRNFGQPAAVLAGFREARGDACAVISADLQDPPELIPEMVRRWRDTGRKIVLATRESREDGYFRRWTSRAFYRLMRRFALPNMPETGFDYFLIDRQVLDFVNQTQEKNSFLQGQVLWSGFEPEVIFYTRRRREIGRSRWTVGRKLTYLVDGFVTFSVAPIRLITAIGLVVSVLSLSYAGVILVGKLVWGIPIEGWAPIMISILTLSGVHLVMLGIIGEYMWRSFYQSRELPSFVVEKVVRSGSETTERPDGS